MLAAVPVCSSQCSSRGAEKASGSPTTRAACRRPATPTSWSTAAATPTTTSAASTPQTTRSAAPGSPVAAALVHPPPDICTGQTYPRPATHSTSVRTLCNEEPTLAHAQSASEPALPRRRLAQAQSASEPALPRRRLGQRSESARDLHDFSFELSGRARHPRNASLSHEHSRDPYSTSYPGTGTLSQESVEHARDPYSTRYPGTTSLSQESVEDTYGLAESQDDISHDSYELLERSEDDLTSSDYRQRKTKSMTTRSCSLDSGNYLPTDSDSDSEKQHKYKSSSDVQSIFLMDDPRDFPREKIPRKSDGNFYKTLDYYDQKAPKRQSFSSRTSSQDSKSDGESKKVVVTKTKCYDNIESRTSSLDSKSDYYDAHSKIVDEAPPEFKYQHDFDRKIQFERNYGVKPPNYEDFPSFRETSHVHSVSLQNVETERNIRTKTVEQNTVPRTHKSANYGRSQSSFETTEPKRPQTTHIWPESIAGVPTEIEDWPSKRSKSTDTESNIFSFDEDKIQSLQESDLELGMCVEHSSYSIVSAMNKNNLVDSIPARSTFRDVFMEIDHAFPRQPIERTKSDPNCIANRQKLGSNARRHMLMHQKSIDLTPAESSDEDYLFKQIPSAPPVVTKYRGTHFELPTAEFGHFDILKREIEGQKTKFEVPKSQFEVLGAKTQSDLVNLPPNNNFDISYVLHKRHVMNGTSKTDNIIFQPDQVVVESSIVTSEANVWMSPQEKDFSDEEKSSLTLLPPPETESSSFLFTQNIDLSKIDPVTLEIDKSEHIQHMASPKRDITKIDPSVMEALSSKLSQIESDSPTSSKTESLKPELKTVKLQKVMESTEEIKITKPAVSITTEKVLKDKIKTELKPKRIIKPRMQPSKKGIKNKTKVRITSFSSDDESLDSDDVFGSAEATPTKLEFSPPQSRKEMEPILKYESERHSHLQYTMSSTEVEGSPPQLRKNDYPLYDRSLDPNYQSELRRISERSISIPSSEEDFKHEDLNRPVFDPIPTSIEEEKDAKTISEDITTELTVTVTELPTEINKLEVKTEQPTTTSESPMVTRKKGQTPMLFAHARLNLSEGSAFTLIQKQTAATSPISSRRAKSLDTPVIPVCKLPALNAFSSKDDTVEESVEEIENVESPVEKVTVEQKKDKEKVSKASKVQDQIVPDLIPKKKVIPKTTIRSNPKTDPSRPQSLKASSKDQSKSTTSKDKPSGQKTLPSKSISPKNQKPPTPKAKTVIREKISSPKLSSPKSEKESKPTLTTQATLQPPEIVRAKSQEMEGTKKVIPKEKSKSFEKLEFKRANSKERAKSQEDSDSDIAKRIEKQQMLYETAIKQTKTLKSPVKDTLPVFPQVEETVRVNDGKLEISIDTIENTNIPLEEAIIITKSPKKLDKKLTKSLELNLTGDENYSDTEKEKSVMRLGKSLDLDDSKEFDFNPEKIKLTTSVVEMSPESDVVEQVIEAEIHEQPQEGDKNENVVLEGTSLDIWLSVDKEKVTNDKLNKIQVIQKSTDNVFFEDGSKEKPPDLPKEGKSSSESHSLEQTSLGNSLDIKYIDESGDSSHKSEKDTKLIKELHNSIAIDSNLSKKIENIIKKGKVSSDNLPDDTALVRITSEDESLTEVSDLKFETADSHLLGYTENSTKGTLLKLSIERSRSEETVSWVTVECDEFVGTDSFDVEEAPVSDKTLQEELAKQASCENETSEATKPTLLSTEPRKGALLKLSSDQSRSSDTTGSWTSGEKDLSPGNVREESSVSCSIAKTIGISQNIELFESLEQLESPLKSPHKLERSSPIDEESSSASNGFPKPREPGTVSEDNSTRYAKTKYPFEQKWGSDSELSQRIHKKISKKLSSADKTSLSSLDDSFSDKRWGGMGSLDKPTLQSLDKLSVESRNSLDTESSSGSLGVAHRKQISGDLPVREPSSTWRPFLMESSGSSELEEGLLPPDQDLETQEYFMSKQACGEYSGNYDLTGEQADISSKDDELAEFPTNFGYPCLTAAIGGIGIGTTDMLAGYGSGFLARTLSRISERSTNSENTSLEEDSTKGSTQSDSVNDESLMSSDHQASLSSDSPGKVGSDKKKSTSSSGKKLESSGNSKQSPEQNIVNINNLLLHRQMSDDRRTSAEMADLSIDDIEIITSERGLKLKRQDSDDTIIDEENETVGLKPSNSQDSEGDWPLPDIPIRYSTNIPKSFGLRGSLKSQDSEQWPSPPSSLLETPVVDSVETYYMCPPEEPCKVTVDSNTDPYDSSEENKTIENEDLAKIDDNKASSGSDSLSGGKSGIKIVLQTKSLDSHSSNSEDLNLTLNDDVFTDAIVDTSRNELRPPTVLRRSTASDDSSKAELKPPSPGSYSEEECTSSMGTNVEGTVRFALKPTKCTHSSHSEDTSVALSLSEWSNSTNTVKFQNLSSNNSGTKSKSDDNSLTEMAQSISDWSSSNTNSNTLVAQTFQKLSSTSESNTITEKISDWSSSDTTIVATQLEYNVNTINIEGCLEQLLEDDESLSQEITPENIPSEDMSQRTKSTERPITFNIQHLLSDTESTSSREIIHQYSLKSTERPIRVPIKFSKCSPYYSSSLSSESTSAAISKPINIRTATVPLTRTHRKSLFQAKSPPSENDSTSSVESPIGTPEGRSRGHRRRRQLAAKRHRLDKERSSSKDEYSEPERFMCGKDFSDLPSDYEYKSDIIRRIYSENVEEGYFPDGDSQSGSDIFRIENDGEYEDSLSRFEHISLDGSIGEAFDVSLIPPPLLEDDFEDPDEEI